jgi:hypothetical protein
VNNGESQALGEILRQAREDIHLSLEEVERETRIRAKFLAALESGDLRALPSDAHAKGFLRNYAQFLGLDAQAMLRRYDTARGIAQPTMNNATPGCCCASRSARVAASLPTQNRREASPASCPGRPAPLAHATYIRAHRPQPNTPGKATRASAAGGTGHRIDQG